MEARKSGPGTRGRPPRPARASRLRGDSGAALVEAAFVTPIFMVLVFGIVEFGGAFRDHLTLGNTTSVAARAAAIAGDDPNADYQVLQAIKKGSSAIPANQITRIVIFRATGPTTPVPAACLAGIASVADACNVYTSSDFTRPEAQFGCGPSAPDRYWCPTSRKTAAKATNGNGPPDYVGIYVIAKHPFVTGLFGSTINLSSKTITRLEPATLT